MTNDVGFEQEYYLVLLNWTELYTFQSGERDTLFVKYKSKGELYWTEGSDDRLLFDCVVKLETAKNGTTHEFLWAGRLLMVNVCSMFKSCQVVNCKRGFFWHIMK